VDYLACQYLEAYAKACFLSTGTTLGDWRSPAGCCKIVIWFQLEFVKCDEKKTQNRDSKTEVKAVR